MKELNLLANAERQFDEAAACLKPDPEGIRKMHQAPRRATIVVAAGA